MVIMAGMLPGVECARRRRLWQGAAEAAAGGTRRPSFCLYAAGHGGHQAAGLGGAAGNSSKQRSSVMEMIHGWTVDSNAREAKERLDQKLSKRETVIKRHHSTGSTKVSRAAHGSGGEFGSAAGGVLEEGGDAVEPAAVGRGGAGGVRGVPGRVPRRRRPGAPPLRPPLPLGLRAALAPGHLPLPLLPRRHRSQQPPRIRQLEVPSRRPAAPTQEDDARGRRRATSSLAVDPARSARPCHDTQSKTSWSSLFRYVRDCLLF